MILDHIIELTPVALAIPAVILCARKYMVARRNRDRIVLALAVICSLLMIFAQTSWWATYVIHGDLLGTTLANVIWTAFNCATMTVFIIMGWPRCK